MGREKDRQHRSAKITHLKLLSMLELPIKMPYIHVDA